MSRLLLIAAALLIAPLAACGREDSGERSEHAKVVTPAPSAEAAVTEAPPSARPTRGNDAACGADKVGRWLNALPTGEVMLDIGRAAGQPTMRYYNQGEPITQDLRAGRLNVEIGADGRIKRFHCG